MTLLCWRKRWWVQGLDAFCVSRFTDVAGPSHRPVRILSWASVKYKGWSCGEAKHIRNLWLVLPEHARVSIFLVVFSIVISLQISAQLPSSGPFWVFLQFQQLPAPRDQKWHFWEIPQSKQIFTRNHLEKEGFAACCGSGKQQSSWLQYVSR